MRFCFTDKILAGKRLLAWAALLLPALSSMCSAQGLDGTSHASIERFLDSDTVLVGWVDVSQLDLDGLQDFATSVGLDSLPKIPEPVQEIRQALVELGVTRVYWVSSLAELLAGPQSVLIPAPEDRSQTVSLLLKAATSDGQSVAVEGNVVLAGNDAAIESLQKNTGPPMSSLLEALTHSPGPHGIVIGASGAALRTASGLLNNANESGTEQFSELNRLLPDLRSVALHGHLPPAGATLQVRMASSAAASQCATLLNAKLTELLEADAAALQLTAEDVSVVIQKESLEESAATFRSLVKLLQPARRRAERTTVMNSLKQLALGMHNFHSIYSRFPPQKLASDNGMPLLSWRVLILPYLGQQDLYEQFHLDEPWDSEHNLQLVAKMPAVFQSPDDSVEMKNAGKTRFVAPLTDASVFGRPGESVRIRDIHDGTSNTLMVVHTTAAQAVVWTKPDDLVLAQGRPYLQQIAGDVDGFAACTCDGASHFLSRKLTQEALQALVSMSAGDIIDWP